VQDTKSGEIAQEVRDGVAALTGKYPLYAWRG
jgi:hypothetical protein